MSEKNSTNGNEEIPKIQRIIAVLWPSFLTAGVAMIIFYWIFSPGEVFPELYASGVGNMAFYSVTFLFLWLTCLVSCLLSCYFLRPCNRCN
jgi:hypothetical protein